MKRYFFTCKIMEHIETEFKLKFINFKLVFFHQSDTIT